MKLDVSSQGWGRVFLITSIGTAFCVAAALYVDSFNFAQMDDAARLRALLTDVLLPLVLAAPLLLFFTSKLRELAIAHRRLTIYASTDGLTQVLNRAAFSTLVEAFLKETAAPDSRVRGALLIIDADDFKSVNDHYGHDKGDEALITIARSIKSILRSPDLVGRIGGEEFGVFLPGAGPEHTETIAERIREAVSDASFSPVAAAAYNLSVSVGGAVFDSRLPFNELFRYADQQLYVAKQHGKNRVAIELINRRGLAAA